MNFWKEGSVFYITFLFLSIPSYTEYEVNRYLLRFIVCWLQFLDCVMEEHKEEFEIIPSSRKLNERQC